MKGFLGGVSIGAVVAVAGAAMWSLSVPLPPQVEVETTTPNQAAQPVSGQDTAPQPPEQRDADLVEVAPSSPQGLDGADTSPIAVLDTDPGSRPEVTIPDGASAGNTAPSGTVVSLPQAPGAAPTGQASGSVPDAPGQDDRPEVSTETAALPEPPLKEQVPPAALDTAEPEAEAAAPEVVQVAPSPDEAAPQDNLASGQGAPAATSASPVLPEITLPDMGQAPQPTARPNLGQSTTAQKTAEPVVQEVVPDGATSAEGAASEAGTDPEQVAAAEPGTGTDTGIDTEASPGIGTPVVPLTERSSTPTLIAGDDPQEQAEDATAASPTPFEINAEPYAALGDRPLMSIILIDDAAAIGAEALAEFPYPLTFAISPDDPRAVEKMQARRAAGFEVLILADLPREAAPQDAETALPVWMKKLPQAVGILEGVETGFQGNRPLADQVVAVLDSAGYGMVTQNSGLNTVQKLALRDGMPSGVVFRDFDGAGQTPRAIRRFLDQAAFRARQEGAVIMLGRLRADTISALLLWGVQDRANQVGLVPISAGLKANLTSQ